jgi:Raf kinase inhibitor-like YbhB/YbcL family protein
MKLTSQSLQANETIPPAHAMGVLGADGPVPGPNRSPHLAWSGAPEGTRSFVVVAVDVSAPSSAEDANKTDRSIGYDFPRAPFYHWALTDIPPSVRSLGEGVDSEGLTPKGKKPGTTDHGVRGINSYREWFGSDPDMGGDYGGYDGPWPPFNDERVHQYQFMVYALDVAHLEVPPNFSAADAVTALEGHVLAQATLIGHYSLNPKARL